MRFKYYAPAVRREDYRLWETRLFLRRMHGNSCRTLIETLLNDNAIDGFDAAYILKLLAGSFEDE
jgi:hypothetical protein